MTEFNFHFFKTRFKIERFLKHYVMSSARFDFGGSETLDLTNDQCVLGLLQNILPDCKQVKTFFMMNAANHINTSKIVHIFYCFLQNKHPKYLIFFLLNKMCSILISKILVQKLQRFLHSMEK